MTIHEQAFTEHHLASDDGIALYLRSYAAETETGALPVVCLPGLSRNCRDFHQLARQISKASRVPRRVITLDSRGRGQSGHDPDPANYNVYREALDVIAMTQALGVTRAIFIGTSRGGLVVHVLAGLAPQLLAGVVLNDIGPVLEIAGLRQIRDYLSVWPQPTDWPQAARALKATHGHGFPIFDDDDWMEMARGIFVERDGVIAPDYDPALLTPMKAMDLSQPVPGLWPQFDLLRDTPMMVIRGEYSTLLSEATVAGMIDRHSSLDLFTALGQAHAPILHKHGPEASIARFLARLD